MIAGDRCTRACGFCAVKTAKPFALESDEPARVAEATQRLGLNHVVITAVARDDVADGGAEHFARTVRETRETNPGIVIEILIPDFNGKDDALRICMESEPHILNHNLETVPRLYKKARPGADYKWSLELLQAFKSKNADVPTKSGLMLGLGETYDEVIEAMKDLRAHNVEMLTLGQYLQPSRDHLAVEGYAHPDEFDELARVGSELGFHHVASGPFVRSSYHADLQAAGEFVAQE